MSNDIPKGPPTAPTITQTVAGVVRFWPVIAAIGGVLILALLDNGRIDVLEKTAVAQQQQIENRASSGRVKDLEKDFEAAQREARAQQKEDAAEIRKISEMVIKICAKVRCDR